MTVFHVSKGGKKDIVLSLLWNSELGRLRKGSLWEFMLLFTINGIVQLQAAAVAAL